MNTAELPSTIESTSGRRLRQSAVRPWSSGSSIVENRQPESAQTVPTSAAVATATTITTRPPSRTPATSGKNKRVSISTSRKRPAARREEHRRAMHSANERYRRDRLANGFSELASILPALAANVDGPPDGDNSGGVGGIRKPLPPSKLNIIDGARDYIAALNQRLTFGNQVLGEILSAHNGLIREVMTAERRPDERALETHQAKLKAWIDMISSADATFERQATTKPAPCNQPQQQQDRPINDRNDSEEEEEDEEPLTISVIPASASTMATAPPPPPPSQQAQLPPIHQMVVGNRYPQQHQQQQQHYPTINSSSNQHPQHYHLYRQHQQQHINYHAAAAAVTTANTVATGSAGSTAAAMMQLYAAAMARAYPNQKAASPPPPPFDISTKFSSSGRMQ